MDLGAKDVLDTGGNLAYASLESIAHVSLYRPAVRLLSCAILEADPGFLLAVPSISHGSVTDEPEELHRFSPAWPDGS